MQDCKYREVSISKEDVLNKNKCPVNEGERQHMNDEPYAIVVRNLMYA